MCFLGKFLYNTWFQLWLLTTQIKNETRRSLNICKIKECPKYKSPVYRTSSNTSTSRLFAVSFSPSSLACLPPPLRYFFLCPLPPFMVPICFLLLFFCLSLLLPSFLGQIFLSFLAPLPLTAFYFLFYLFLVIFLPSLFYYTHNCFLPYPLPFVTHKQVLAQTFALAYRLKASEIQGSFSQDS